MDPSSIPGYLHSDAPLPDHWTIPGTDIQIARTPEDNLTTGDYLFTPDSIANLAEYYSQVHDLPVLQPRRYLSFHREHINSTGPLIPDWLVNKIPDSLKVIYLNTPVWKIIAVVGVIFCVIILIFLWVRVVRTQGGRGTALRRLGWRFTLPIMILALYIFSDWFVIAHINPAGLFATGERLISTAGLYAIVAWAVVIGCFLVAEIVINTPRIVGNSLDAHMIRLAARICAIGSACGILIYGANEVGIPAFGLIAGIGVGGVALALAAQSTMENLFGGVALFADRPFRIGEVISFGDERGAVEEVGTRSSRIRALDGTLVSVPNRDLAKMKIVNFSRRDKCLFLHTLALRVDTQADQIRLLLIGMRNIVSAEDMVEKSSGSPRIRCTGIAIGYIELELRAYILTNDYTRFLAIQEKLLLQVFELIEKMGIKLAPGRPFVQADINPSIL